ncbi:hypothetical protein MNV84_04701 [Leishmania braziliensis]|nr:hypothetical protein MNV84_04701 [Leishmania braziliensis]
MLITFRDSCSRCSLGGGSSASALCALTTGLPSGERLREAERDVPLGDLPPFCPMLSRPLSVWWSTVPRRHGRRCPIALSASVSHSQHRRRSSHVATCYGHPRTCHYSSHSLVGRRVSAMSSGVPDAPTSAEPWVRLVHLVLARPLSGQRSLPLKATDAPALADVAHVGAALPAIHKLWMSAYHPAFAVVASDSDAQWQQHRLLPEEAEELPLFVEALGQLAAALQALIVEKAEAAAAAAAAAEGDDDDTATCLEVHEWFVELQALLLFIGQHHLRFLIPTTFSSALSSLAAASLVPETHKVDQRVEASDSKKLDRPRAENPQEVVACDGSSLEQAAKEPMAGHTSALPVVVKSNVPGAAPLRRLSRRESEDVQHMAPPLPVEELLRVVVLVEAARTILDVANPPPLASGVRAEVYGVLLSVVSVSEQLSSTTLASLAACLARCVDSYVTCQQLSAVACAPPEPAAVLGEYDVSGGAQAPREHFMDGRRAALSAFLRRVSLDVPAWVTGRSLTISPSPIEQQEAAQLERLRGGLGTRLRPTEVLHHLRILANVLQRRLAETLYHSETGRNTPQSHQEAERCCGSDAVVSVSSTGAARVAREARLEAGMLGILPLEQYKARLVTRLSGAESTVTTQTRRKRRTVAAIRAAADRERVSEGNFAAHSTTNVSSLPVPHGRASPPSSTPCDSFQHPCVGYADCRATDDNTRVSLTDLAEMCSAMAAIGFRGDSTAAEEPMWRHAVEFACAEIVAMADARDAGDAMGHADDEDAADVAVDREAVIRQALLDARDLCFALDWVGYTRGYDHVMAMLVRCGFLCEPIPAPSAVRRSMKDITCSV